MYKHALNEIRKSKLNISPFPHFIVKNLIPLDELNRLNKLLPSFKEIDGEDILFQSTSQTKKTVLPSSAIYKKLIKKKIFKKVDEMFKKLKPEILKKFESQIKLHVKKKYQKSKLNYHSSFSLMRKGYIKSSHLDRRDHLLHILYYPYSDSKNGGDLRIDKLKKHKKVYDIFPGKKDLITHRKYKVKNNSCLFTLNVPWAYHSVSKYKGNKDRKYFYIVYDFPIEKVGSKLKNRKKGFNLNDFWNSRVSTKSNKRKKIFLSE